MTSIKATGIKVFAEEGGHWYTKTGEPMYDVPNASKPGQKRPTTIRDARKLGLVPSATTIMKGEAKPQLTNWIRDQGMMACLTLPRLPGEDDTQFMKRALQDSDVQKNKAAERGTFLHGIMEAWLRDGHPPEMEEEHISWVRPAVEWIHANFEGYSWFPESSFAYQDEDGQWYGGKRDLCGEHPDKPPVIIDYKCKQFATGSEKKLAYIEHVTQLAAYGNPWRGLTHRAVNVFVSTQDRGHFVPHEWSWDDVVKGKRAFKALTDLWNARNEL